GGRRPDRLATLAAEVLPDRRDTDAVARRTRREVHGLRRRVRVAAQQRDLRGDAGGRCREAARRQRRLVLLLVCARRARAATVVRVQTREVVEAAADLPAAREREPARLEHRLRERDVAADALRAPLVDEDLRELLHTAGQRRE